MKTFLTSLRLLAVLTLLTGLLYPLAVWAVGQAFFRDAAEGSLLHRDGRLVGSALLAQKTTDPRYFWPRPSAGDYATVASGASNQAWSSAKLAAAIAERRAAHGGDADLPADLLTASGGGLDPHLSPAAVLTQTDRVAQARHLDAAQRVALNDLVARHLEGGQLSPARVNILRLNLALDTAFPTL
jgi:K+-transporting ATPase ATPase C chain